MVKFRAEGDRLEFYRWGCEPSPTPADGRAARGSEELEPR